MLSDLIFLLWLLLMGAVGGSALMALADRLVSGRSWLQDRSACETCGQVISWGDLVPVVSFLRLHGRCRACQARLPQRLIWAEIAGIGCAALAILATPDRTEHVSGTLFLLLLLGLFLCDLRAMRLPDLLTAALAAVGMWIGTAWHGFAVSAATAVIGVGLAFTLAMLYRHLRGHDGLGMGDIKMIAGLSAMAGPMGLPWMTLIASCAGLTMAVWRKMPAKVPLPFGCYLAVAGGAVWVAQAVRLI